MATDRPEDNSHLVRELRSTGRDNAGGSDRRADSGYSARKILYGLSIKWKRNPGTWDRLLVLIGTRVVIVRRNFITTTDSQAEETLHYLVQKNSKTWDTYTNINETGLAIIGNTSDETQQVQRFMLIVFEGH